MQTQKEWVLEQLKAGREITAKDAMDERGIMQMGTRIFELRADGWDIQSPLVEVENRYGQTCTVAKYYLDIDTQSLACYNGD